MLKKLIVVSNSKNADIKWLQTFEESDILTGLNAVLINTLKDAKDFGRLLYKHQLFDIFIFSRSKHLLNVIYEIYPYARLVYMPDTFNSLPDLSKETLSNHSNTVCLKAQHVSSQMIRRLKFYGVTVFAFVEKQTDIYQAVLAGVDGIIGDQIDKSKIDIKGDYAFTPFVIAHRGLHKDVQENSLASLRNAIDVKADFIELDFHMTKDKQIVVNHDDSLGRTYEKDYVIKKEKLKSLQSVKMVYKNEKTEEHIQTLTGFYKQMRDTNSSLLIESKVTSVVAMKKMRSILKDMDKPPLLMSFYPFALVHFKKYLKEYNRGFLVDLQNNHMSLPDMIKIANKYNLMIHPYHQHNKNNLIDSFRKRAIMYCPWGVSSPKDLKQHFLSGFYGINTDESDMFIDIVKYLIVKTKYTYEIGESLELEAYTDKGIKLETEIEVLFDNPQGIVTQNNLIIDAQRNGLSYVYLKAHIKTNLVEYTLFSDLITVEVKNHV